MSTITAKTSEISASAHEYCANCFQHVLDTIEENPILDATDIKIMLRKAIKIIRDREVEEKINSAL